MGNHAVGRAFVAVAEAMYERRLPDETALAILDAAAEKTEIHGADAEFDDAFYDDGPFRRLVMEAFADGQTYEDDEDGEGFYEGVERPFSERYRLC